MTKDTGSDLAAPDESADDLPASLNQQPAGTSKSSCPAAVGAGGPASLAAAVSAASAAQSSVAPGHLLKPFVIYLQVGRKLHRTGLETCAFLAQLG